MAIFVIPEVVEIDLRFFDQLYSRKVLFDWLYRVGLLLRVVLVSCCSPLAISLQLLCKFEYQRAKDDPKTQEQFCSVALFCL